MTDPKTDTGCIAQSPNSAEACRAPLVFMIPDAFSEGRFDVSALKRALGGEALIDDGERYALNWAGKANAYKVFDMKPREIIAIDGVFHDSDPLKSNLDLQCRDAVIKFTCI